MIEKLAELNRVLLAVNELIDAHGYADVEAVIEHCKSIVIEARMPKHETSITFAEQIGLLVKNENKISLTEDGSGFVDLNPTAQYDLSDEQKRVLLRTCYMHGPLREQTRTILIEFAPALGGNGLRWSVYDSSPFPNDWVAEHLTELGLLLRREDGWEVKEEYINTVAVFLEEGQGWSEEKFKEYLKEKEEMGKIGEDLVKRFEADRLMQKGHAVEARCVRRISSIRVNAGYDIESFDGPSPSIAYDRFIEVKAAKGQKMRFFWTENEIKVARQLGQRYWIYFQGGISVKSEASNNEPIMIRDPIKSILGDAQFTTTPQGVIVESELKAKRKKVH